LYDEVKLSIISESSNNIYFQRCLYWIYQFTIQTIIHWVTLSFRLDRALTLVVRPSFIWTGNSSLNQCLD